MKFPPLDDLIKQVERQSRLWVSKFELSNDQDFTEVQSTRALDVDASSMKKTDAYFLAHAEASQQFLTHLKEVKQDLAAAIDSEDSLVNAFEALIDKIYYELLELAKIKEKRWEELGLEPKSRFLIEEDIYRLTTHDIFLVQKIQSLYQFIEMLNVTFGMLLP